MKPYNKISSEELRLKLKKAIKVQDRCNWFEGVQREIEIELNRRNRAAIYRVGCWALKNRHFPNQFAAAAHYADAVINGTDYFSTDDHHEIDSIYTKSGNPVIVWF